MDRRTFIHAAGAAGAGLAGLGAAASSSVSLARNIEEWPRERIPTELARLIHTGLPYQELLAALALAATHSIQPYPIVGFKYHSVMVLRPIHATTQQLPPTDRWLPAVWAADAFKVDQAQEKAAGGWQMPSRAVPQNADPQAARKALIAALDRWDREGADAALLACVSTTPPQALFPLLFPYGARDLRSIGHKAITLSNAHTLVGLFGPSPTSTALLRSSVAALVNSENDPDPTTHDLAPDRPWRLNRERLRDFPRTWKNGHANADARRELRTALYEVSPEESGKLLIDILRAGLSPTAIWQALFTVAAELVIHLPAIVTVHAQTTTHALHHAYGLSEDEQTQQLILLQTAAFIAMFRSMVGMKSTDVNLELLEPMKPHASDPLGDIFSDQATNRMQAIRKSIGYLEDGGSADRMIGRIRHHLVYGANESHNYKVTQAVLEAHALFADPPWQSRYLAAGMAYFTHAPSRPQPVIAETLRLLSADH